MNNRRMLEAIAAVGLVVATACGGGESSAEIRIEVLSSAPEMVTGGDALVRITVPESVDPGTVEVRLGTEDVTGNFQADGSALTGLLTNLSPGSNALVASAQGAREGSLALVSYPLSGPVFAGPHEQPFMCQTEEFKLPNGETLGAPLDDDCSIATRVDYLYRSTAGGDLKPLPDPSSRPGDLAQVTVGGATVPYIVRLETGTANRAIYQLAMLHDPATEPAPDFLTRAAGWNGRLVYIFGGGCLGGWYRQGASIRGIDDDAMLGQGYAVASATLNVFGNNCNDLLAAETMMTVKERFVEAFGSPAFTIGWGCSGGSYQVYQIADNYPGLLDGIVAGCSFPDVGHAAVSVHSFGARLLYHYFTETAGVEWTEAQRVAASGLPDHTSLRVQGTRSDRINPRGVCSPAVPSELLYDPVNNPHGARCTVYDHTVNVYGRDPETGFTRRILDNVGVQYGLQALNDGVTTKAQFLDLNERIGGVDIDANPIPERTVGDPVALRAGYATGRILSGGGGLAATPVIDYRGYSDFRNGDPHQRFHSFSIQARLIAANGHADNMVMIVEDGATYGLFSTESPIVREALRSMDRWLSSLTGDTSADPAPQKVVRAKPADLVDACYDGDERIVEEQTYRGEGRCNSLFPSHANPYIVAGMPVANNVLKCRLKAIDASDYAVSFTDSEMVRLQRIFPDGVCDYSQPGVEQGPLVGTWVSFGPSPMNRFTP